MVFVISHLQFVTFYLFLSSLLCYDPEAIHFSLNLHIFGGR